MGVLLAGAGGVQKSPSERGLHEAYPRDIKHGSGRFRCVHCAYAAAVLPRPVCS